MAFQSDKSFICNKCGKREWGKVYYLNNSPLCFKCYQAAQESDEKNKIAQGQLKLYNYIKDLFKTDVTSEVKSSIEKWVKKGKKYNGIQYTLYYFYELMGNPVDSMALINWVIETQYDNAKNYAYKQLEINKKNATVDINVASNVIKFTEQNKPGAKKKTKYDYKIEEL